MNTIILVIDDEKVVREIVVEALKTFGYSHILEADSGAVGIGMIKERNPDLVIADLTMPGMRGEQVLRWVVREHKPQHPAIKLMAYSGDGLETTESVARAAGADSFLAKPFRVPELKAAIEAVLAKP